jgi:hypothetical protein
MAFDFAQAKLDFGQIVVVELDGVELVFRPLKPSEAHRVAALATADPENALDASLAACRGACVSDLAEFDRLADIYPLAFSGDEGVIGELIRLAQGAATLRVKDAVGMWKRADRNPGRMAENLLAFKSYTGGDYSAEAFAGALTLAEHMQVTKGTFNLFLSLMKALAKRR